MLVNSINSVYDEKVSKSNKQKQGLVGFKGLNPEVAKNQMRIFLTQDIWAPKLKVKMPESSLEKDVLLEVLKNRLQLDRFVRLTNERFATKGNIILYNELVEKNIESPEKVELKKEIDKKGNLLSYFSTLDKQIELEGKKNKEALSYFDNIDETKGIYLSRKLVKESKMNKFFSSIVKNNINKNQQYSTKELINIIEAGEMPERIESTKDALSPKVLTKKQLLVSAEALYEDLLRQYVNVYDREFHHFKDSRKARAEVEETYKDSISKYPEVKKSLIKIYENIEKKFIHKVNKIAEMNVYPIGEIWVGMAKVEAEMRNYVKEINSMKQDLVKNPTDETIREKLEQKEGYLREIKEEWTKAMLYSVKYEKYNNERMIEAGNKEEYSYIAGKNPTILKHKKAAQIYEENNNSIPKKYWEELIA